jgi:hypothetical protein
MSKSLTDLDMIHKIKTYKEPPYKKEDMFFTRYPWNLFGGVSSGICEKWYWYYDDMILERASHDAICDAYNELVK